MTTDAIDHGKVRGMAELANPVIQRRQLAMALRDARMRADLTIDQVAEHLMCSTAKVSRMETGHRPASPRDVRDLCGLYKIDDGQRDRLIQLARESRRPGWWDSHKLPPTYSAYVGLESVAVSIRDFKSSMVPGFLQTPSYARAIITSFFSPADPHVVERLTQTRMQRQEKLFTRDEPPALHVVMDEAALRRVVGGRDTMAEQLDRLVDDAEVFDIQLQVIPFARGAHAGLETTFSILSFADPAIQTAAFAEDVFGIIQLNDDDLKKCQRIFDQVAQTALPPEESIELIRQIRLHTYGDGHQGADDAEIAREGE